MKTVLSSVVWTSVVVIFPARLLTLVALVLSLSLSLSLSLCAKGDDENGIDIEKRKSFSMGVIQDYEENPSDAGFFKVLEFLGLGERGERMLGAHREVFDRASKAIVRSPDYSGRIQRRLDSLREDHLTGKGEGYDRSRDQLFASLGFLQEPEVVLLLIKLLDDERDAGKIRAADGIIYTLLSDGDYAGIALIALIEDLPLRRDRFGDPIRDVSALRQWGASVVDGSQTFRFKGDPRKFTIHGPVETPARVVKASPVLKTTSEESAPASLNRTPALILAMLVLLAAVAALLAPRIRKANRG